MYRGILAKCRLFLQILMKNGFSQYIFSKNTQIEILMKIRLVGTELFHADVQTDGRTDGRTDMTKLIAAFLYFANAPNTAKRLQCYMLRRAMLHYAECEQMPLGATSGSPARYSTKHSVVCIRACAIFLSSRNC
jgi:hypothetical protein